VSAKTPHFRAFVLLLVTAAVSGCALDPGQPWGRLSLTASARFAPSASRLTASGALKTVHNEAIKLADVRLRVASVSATVAGDATDISFDPASPPAGYSLCHNGHCHRDDGTLPTYDEIKVELAGTAGGGTTVTWAASGEWLTLGKEPVTVVLGACDPGCDVPRGKLVAWRAKLTGMAFAGAAEDLSGGQAKPIGGTVTWQSEAVVGFSRSADVHFDREHAPGVDAHVMIDLPESLLDGVVFGDAIASVPAVSGVVDLSAVATVTQAVHEKLSEEAALQVSVDRTEL
jgi:hypothetical protein